MPLSDLSVRKAKPREKPYKLTDESGLFLIVNPSGSKWWRLNFTMAGQPRRTMSLGIYPDVELAEARAERERIRKLVRQGIDPVRERKREAGDAAATFEAVARRWLNARRKKWTDKYASEIENRLNVNVFPYIGKRDIRALEAADMLTVMRRIQGRGVIETAIRLNGQCGQIFQFAVAEGYAARDVAHDIRAALESRPKVQHRKRVDVKEMPTFLAALAADDTLDVDTKDAMRLTILTAVRTTETLYADVREFSGLEGDEPLWRIPKERMKMEREHLVPLSRQAADLIKRRIAMLRPGQTLLFARPTKSGTLSSNTLIFGLYRLGWHSKATIHGFRSVFSTVANESLLWNPDAIEWQLAHVSKNKVRSAYNAAQLMPERRGMLQWYADWIDAQERAGKSERAITALIG